MPRSVPSQTISRAAAQRLGDRERREHVPAGAARHDHARASHGGAPFRRYRALAGGGDLVVHAQQHADPGERHEHARAAVRQERQRQALGRQQAHVHADVDEGLQAEPDAEAGRETGMQRHAGVRGDARERAGSRSTSARKREHDDVTPSRPNSSASTANTKSVCASGR